MSALTPALDGLTTVGRALLPPPGRVFRSVTGALTGRPGPPRVERGIAWLNVIGTLPALLYRAASPLVGAEYRTALLDLVQSCLDSGLIRPGGLVEPGGRLLFGTLTTLPEVLDRLADVLAAPDLILDTSARTTAALRILRGEELRTLVSADVPGADGPAQDPNRSVPTLVDEVASTLHLTADAATVYLQLLALPDPTDRNVRRWTGWTPARRTNARAELAATDLVVTAKRPRAGRGQFLPGGWLTQKAPRLPVETWKTDWLPFAAPYAGLPWVGPLVPTLPVPTLFTAAWARVQAGDRPRFTPPE